MEPSLGLCLWAKSPISSTGIVTIAVDVAAFVASIGLLWLFVGTAICLTFIGIRFLGRELATDLGVSVLLAVGTFDFGPYNAAISPVLYVTMMVVMNLQSVGLGQSLLK